MNASTKSAYTYLQEGNYGFMLTPDKGVKVHSGFGLHEISCGITFKLSDAAAEEATEPDDADTPLEDAAQSEREYVRQRLREELKREPTESELDEWLRQHTEGY